MWIKVSFFELIKSKTQLSLKTSTQRSLSGIGAKYFSWAIEKTQTSYQVSCLIREEKFGMPNSELHAHFIFVLRHRHRLPTRHQQLKMDTPHRRNESVGIDLSWRLTFGAQLFPSHPWWLIPPTPIKAFSWPGPGLHKIFYSQ